MSTNQQRDDHYDAFLSYQSGDEEQATRLGSRLEADFNGNRKIRIFYAPWDIAPGQNLVDRIDEGLTKAKFFLLMLSPDAITAGWPTAERAAAILSDPSGRLGKVIPIIARSCRIPPLLAFRNYIDVRDKAKYEQEITRLLCILKGTALPRGSTLQGGSQIMEAKISPLTEQISEPDLVSEDLYSNIFRVTKLPQAIWSAPTKLVKNNQVFEYFGRESIAPPFILRENRLFAFFDLARDMSPFEGVTENYDFASDRIGHWMSDEDYRRSLIHLANDAIRAKCWQLQLKFDKKGKKYYYPQGVLKNEKITWFPHVKKSARSLIIDYKRDGRTVFYRHRAVNLRFVLLGNSMFLRIDPGWIFSFDGRRLIEGRRRSVLNTKINSRQKNSQVLDETRFWAWLLSEDGKTIKFDLGAGQFIEVEAVPYSTYVDRGIFGDWKEMPSTVEAPPDLVENGEDESVIDEEDVEDDEDE